MMQSMVVILILFLSTLSLRRATRRSVKLFRQNYISIHALLAESDKTTSSASSVLSSISIHALLAESDCAGPYTPVPISIFLSTLSLRRATITLSTRLSTKAYFYPRSPCGERLLFADFFHRQAVISIHALLAESDYFFAPAAQFHRDFYPRSPCGERLIYLRLSPLALLFLSTLSLRRATW